MQNDRVEIRKIEPYCYGQFTEGRASPHAGRSHVHWLTGTASTVMVGCVEGILGMRPDLGGIKLAPSIPKEWKALEIWKEFRGNQLHIQVENPRGRESGCTRLTVNGREVPGDYVPEALLTETTEVHWIVNPNQDGVYQQKLDEALAKQGSAPWVDGSTVVVDQNMMNWVERSMTDTQEKINHNVPGQWIDEWNKDMGPDSKVFCFFLPAWGLDVCIKPNVEGTDAAQDWAVCPSPQSFFWGGTWLVAANGTDNASQVRDIMLTMTADRDLLRTLAMNYGEMSNDQPLMEELAQSPDFGIDMLGGQNYIGVLSDAAASISLANVSPYDQGCTEEFQNTFGDYFNGKIDLEKAKANFEKAIGERYPELKSGGVRWPS